MVLESVVFGVLAAAGWGIADFVAALAAKGFGLLRTILGMHVASVGVLSVYVLAATDLGQVSPGQWGALWGIAIIAFATYFIFYRALQLGPVAIVSPVASTYAVVVILLAVVFAGERLSGGQSIGASASIGGVVLASTNLRGIGRGERLMGTGVLLAIISTLFGGLWQYLIGAISREIGWFLTIYMSRLLTLALLAPAIMATRQWPWQRLTIPLLLVVATAGLVETGGMFAFARGTEVGAISIVAAASITYPVIPMLGGMALFGERLSVTQALGLVIALTGLLVLALST